MVKVDLITGLLGSGKTTFSREYVKYLTEVAGEMVCILENDYGAINVGFITAENFINIFKDKFGMSPLEYRLIHRKK